jgi:hypothetical protein
VRLLLDGRLVCAPFDGATGRGYTFTATGSYRRRGVATAGSSGRSRLGAAAGGEDPML